MKIFTLISTAIVLSGSILSASQAASISDIPSAVVKFGDLDIAHRAGQEALYQRLTRAARTVCSPLEDISPRSLPTPQYKTCLKQALTGAVAKIDLPAFSDYVAARLPSSNRPAIQLAAR